MALINLVKLTDTFNTFMNLVNSIINKINKIEVTETSVKLSASTNATGPVADADIANNQGVLFLNSSGILHIRKRDSGGNLTTVRVYDNTTV